MFFFLCALAHTLLLLDLKPLPLQVSADHELRTASPSSAGFLVSNHHSPQPLFPVMPSASSQAQPTNLSRCVRRTKRQSLSEGPRNLPRALAIVKCPAAALSPLGTAVPSRRHWARHKPA